MRLGVKGRCPNWSFDFIGVGDPCRHWLIGLPHMRSALTIRSTTRVLRTRRGFITVSSTSLTHVLNGGKSRFIRFF